jgi:hypothetical protein
MKYGQYPVIFTKPAGAFDDLQSLRGNSDFDSVDALAGPFEDIPIHPECKEMDYEVRPFLHITGSFDHAVQTS